MNKHTYVKANEGKAINRSSLYDRDELQTYLEGIGTGFVCDECGRLSTTTLPVCASTTDERYYAGRTQQMCAECRGTSPSYVPFGPVKGRFVQSAILGVENEGMPPLSRPDLYCTNDYRRMRLRLTPEHLRRGLSLKDDCSVVGYTEEGNGHGERDCDYSYEPEDCEQFREYGCEGCDCYWQESGDRIDGTEATFGPITREGYEQGDLPLAGLCAHTDNSEWVGDRYDDEPLSVGTHIHVWKGTITMLHAWKMLTFFSDESNIGPLEALAGREANNFCRQVESARGRDVKVRSEKYEQLASRNSTFEFRLFQGAEDEPTLRGYVEFVLAFVDWTRNASLLTLSWDAFTSWLAPEADDPTYVRGSKGNHGKYPHLCKLIERRVGW